MESDTRGLRVVMIVPSLGTTGGLERVATTLALGAAPRLARLVVCSRGGGFQQVLEAAGVHVDLITRPRQRPTLMLRSARDLARVLRREQPHLVHAHNPVSAAAARLALPLAGLRGTPIVTSYHGVALDSARHAVPVLRRTSDLVLAVAPGPARALLAGGFPRARLVTILNAVDPRPTRTPAEVREELAVAQDEPLVVSVGRYVPEKNQRLLLDAVARIRRGPPRTLIVGEGDLEDELRAHALALGLDRAVTLTGPRDDAESITAAADVFVLSSASEGLPLALLEAMALGRAVAATDVGGIGDAVRSGESGLLVQPDDPDALAAAIERLLDDPALRLRLGTQARAALARRFSPAVMVERTLRVYASVTACDGRRSRRRAANAP